MDELHITSVHQSETKVRNWNTPKPTLTLTARRAPDDWIGDFINGVEEEEQFSNDYQRGGAVKVELATFDGSPPEWFSWIGIFKALVHDARRSPEEKLAILRCHLKGKCRDVIANLGGGIDAYREALKRLHATCGRRIVLRTAHLKMLDQLDPGKGDPTALERFAEKVRNHLFELSRIGDHSNGDIIERLSQAGNQRAPSLERAPRLPHRRRSARQLQFLVVRSRCVLPKRLRRGSNERGYGSDLEKTSAPPTASSRGNGSPALYQMPEQPPPRPMPGIRRPERERPGRVGKVEQPLLLMFWISAPGPTLQAPETMRHPGLSAKSSSAAP